MFRNAILAVLTPIRHNATCYPGIICDGTEKEFYECKYDRTQTAKNVSDLFAIITRCISKRRRYEDSFFHSSFFFLVDGGFSAWSEWSTCTQTCGAGQMTRSRNCTEPAPSVPEPDTVPDDHAVGGLECTGDFNQVKTCNSQPCP